MSEDASLRDPLAACLVVAARLHGAAVSVEALTAGLPLEAGLLTPALLPRAAERAGLSARRHDLPLAALAALSAPAVLLLRDRKACVLVGADATHATVAMPEAGDGTVRMPLDELAARYEGAAFVVGRQLRFAAGTSSERAAERHHWFWGALRRSWRIYAEVAVATVLINLFTILSPLFFMNVYDRVVPNRAIETLWVLAAGVLAMYVFDLLLKSLRGYFIDLAGKRADLMLSSTLFEQVMDRRLDGRREPVGTLASNLREFESLRDFFTSATLVTLVDLPFVLVFLGVLLAIGGWPIAAVTVVAIPLVLGTGLALQVPLRDRIRRSFGASEAKYATLIETLSAIEAVKSLGAASQLQRKWEGLVEFAARENLATRFLSSFAVNFSGFVQLSVAVVTVLVGVYLIADNALTTGALIASTIIAGRAITPLTQVAALLIRYHQAMSALAALDKVMAAPVERPRGASFLARPRFRGEIQFRDVAFRYPDRTLDALDGVSFTIRAGDRVGVIGRVGSGKSTLAKLLVGLYEPQSGGIVMDGTDLRQIDPADLRRNIGYLPQSVVLFSGSVRENLALGAPHASDEAILRAARLAGLEEAIGRNPQGYDLAVGERGEALSGGQRQLVALGRALLLDPPILLLDEPAQAMDHSSEDRLKQRLAAEFGDRTLVLITHRESMLSLVDTLLVLDAGKVVAFGPKERVLQALAAGKVAGAA